MSTIVDRYVHATLRTVAPSRREEIGRELRSSIEDMVDARTENGEPEEGAERAVLNELGDPDRLAVQYTGMRQVLIGPRYFLTWWRLLIRLLVVVPVVVMGVVGVVEVVDGSPFGTVLGEVIGTGLSVAVHVAFWTTLAFALIDRFGFDVDLPEWTVDDLPDVPQERSIPLADTIASIVFYLALVGTMVWQHFAGWVRSDGGSGPALDPELWSSWLPLLIVVLVLSAVFELVLYGRGEWTIGLAVVNAVLSLAFLVPVVYLLLQQMLLSDLFVQAVGMTAEVERNIGVGASVGIVAVVAWEIGDGFVKAVKARGVARERAAA